MTDSNCIICLSILANFFSLTFECVLIILDSHPATDLEFQVLSIALYPEIENKYSTVLRNSDKSKSHFMLEFISHASHMVVLATL